MTMASIDEIAAMIQDRSPAHLAGIGGVGMAGLAVLLQSRGIRVSGCDVHLDNPFVAMLRERGISVSEGHDPGHLGDVEWVVHTAALSGEHPELLEARARGIPVWRRGLVLPALLQQFPQSVAVAGTHGKTTTATFISRLLKHCGRDPAWVIGGWCETPADVAHDGRGGVVVAEADESDGTLAHYKVDIAVITNIEFDHMEHFDSVADFEDCFIKFACSAENLVLSADDERIGSLRMDGCRNIVRFGFDESADLRGELVDQGLQLWWRGCQVPVLPLPVALRGRHNLQNLMAALAASLVAGCELRDLLAAVASLALPKRRFERVIERFGVSVISDYAHHPTELRALMEVARSCCQDQGGRLRVVFQPHRYTRTAALGADFPSAFTEADELILVPVYAASEPPSAAGTIGALYAHFREQGQRPLLASSLAQAEAYLWQSLRPGDWVIVAGAGDVEWIAHELKRRLTSAASLPVGLPRPPEQEGLVCRRDEPLGRKTTYGLGGGCDLWFEVETERGLSSLLRFCCEHALPLTLLGAGSNLLISDLGVRGAGARLTGEAFRGIRREGNHVIAGAAVPLARLHDYLTGAALTGLEFLESVPGGVGGILRMNGGAYGHEVNERILWIRGLNRAGEVCIFQGHELEWTYRGCETLKDYVVTEACFALEPGDSDRIREARDVIAQKRAWMNGLRCSGSVFRNPPGAYAGALIEAVGLKGMCIGGASVSGKHGNFIVAGTDAVASDVLAVIDCVEQAVACEKGIALVREVVCLG